MLRSFDGLALRQLRTRRLRSLLTMSAVALGVGMMLGVLLLSGTVRATFDDLIDSAWGSIDLVVAPDNNAGTMSDQTLATVRATPGVKSAGPMVGASLTRLDSNGNAVKGQRGQMWVAGFETATPPYDFKYTAGHPPAGRNQVVVERAWADDRDLALGESFGAVGPTGRMRLRIVGLFEFTSGQAFGGPGLAGVTLAEARRLFDLPTGLHQISVHADDRDAVAALKARLKRTLGTRIDVQTPNEVADDVRQQMQALDVVLLLFGGMALFVGGFLILNSFTMTVLQRTRELGMLRTLGADRRAIARSVLLEALALGSAGVVAGLLLGAALAQGLIVLLRGLNVPIGDLRLSAGSIVIAATAGIGATLLGATLPARAASRTSPVQAALGANTAGRARPPLRRLAVAAVMFAPGLFLGGSFWFGDQNGGGALWSAIGIGGTMVMFAGMVMAAPFIVPPVIAALAVPLRRLAPTTGRLAADAARTNVRRTAATAITLAVGLAVVTVNATMAQTFVSTIERQISGGYARDATVRPLGGSVEQGGAQVVPRDVRREIESLPHAGVVTPLRLTLAKLPGLTDGAPSLVEGVDPAVWGQVDQMPLDGAGAAAAMRALARGEVIVGSVYAASEDLHAGDTLRLTGPRGTRTMRIAATQRTAGEFAGALVLMSHASMRAIYGVTQDAQLVVKARSAGERDALAASIDRVLERHPGIESLSTAEIQDNVEARIDQQFNLFNAIVAIAVLASLLGVVNTLAMSVLERTREIGVLRALGASRWSVRATMLAESVLITLSGALIGLAAGVAIAFWWSRALGDMLPGTVFALPLDMLIGVAVAGVVLGALAAILPARRAGRMDVVAAIAAE